MRPDGIYYGLPRAEYDAMTDRLNWSVFKTIGESPAHFRQVQLEPPEDKDTWKFGRVEHLAVFEPERFRASIAVWEGGIRRGKAWDAFCERNEGKELLTEKEHADVLAIANAIRATPQVQQYVAGGKSEVTILWTYRHALGVPGAGDVAIPMKSRIDFIADVGAIVDLKTATSASPRLFGTQAARLDYVTQTALYRDAYVSVGGDPLPCKLIPVEKKKPYVSQVYNVTERQLAIGREKYRELLGRLVVCRQSNHYGGYADGELDLELPTWADPDAGESIEELDLVGLEQAVNQ